VIGRALVRMSRSASSLWGRFRVRFMSDANERRPCQGRADKPSVITDLPQAPG